jgi:hypothetical protein
LFTILKSSLIHNLKILVARERVYFEFVNFGRFLEFWINPNLGGTHSSGSWFRQCTVAFRQQPLLLCLHAHLCLAAPHACHQPYSCHHLAITTLPPPVPPRRPGKVPFPSSRRQSLLRSAPTLLLCPPRCRSFIEQSSMRLRYTSCLEQSVDEALLPGHFASCFMKPVYQDVVRRLLL